MNQAAPRTVRRIRQAGRLLRLLLPVGLAWAASGCRSDDSPPQPPAEVRIPEWSYQGERGPEAWGALDPAFEACSKGLLQSPINLESATARDLPNPEFRYAPVRVQLKNDGRSLSAQCEAGASLRLDEGVFELVEFHFHHPAEHRLADRQNPMELHFVHRAADGAIAVVAVLFREGETNRELDRFWDSLPGNPGEQGFLAQAIDLQKLLPADRRGFRYTGSLTTPPCTEGVLWVVLADSLEASPDQMEVLRRAVGDNSRPTQPRNQREVLLDVSRDQ